MQTPIVTFVETMRGQVVMTQFVGSSSLATPESEDDQGVAASLQQGIERDLALPMIWQDLTIAVHNQPTTREKGLVGVIESGKLFVGGLAAEPLVIHQGEFALLPATPPGERRMRYRLACTAEDGRRYLLYGFKRIANVKGRFLPLAIWRDTTTLYVTIYELDPLDAPKALVATGIIHIHPIGFLRQLGTMRSSQVVGAFAALRNLASFGGFFALGVLAAYLPQSKLAPGQGAPREV